MNDPAVAVKLALVAPATAVTDDGNVTLALLELSAIDAPEDGVGLLSVIRQVEVPPGFNDAGLQLTTVTTTG